MKRNAGTVTEPEYKVRAYTIERARETGNQLVSEKKN
jgi:hypothetical protein